MALLTAIVTPVAGGSAYSPQAVSASDTIPQAAMGPRGCILIVINAGGVSDTVGVVDGASTASGNLGQTLNNPVANGTTEVMFIPASTVNTATSVTTITHSSIASVTCLVIAGY